MKAAGVPEGFSLKDLMKPDLPHVMRNLSAMINFCKFREDKIAPYNARLAELVGTSRLLAI